MINKIFKDRYFLIAIQFITLLSFALLIFGAIGITTDDKAFAKVLRNTNLSNLIVWSYWWPFIIVTAILFGRFWCTICPMELITSFAGKLGLKQKPGKVLKSGWIITLFYALILILGIHTFSIHRIPQLMAIYMIVLLIVALVVGFVWEKRTFCTYVCPIGHLLGLYSLLSSKKLRVIDESLCESCKTKDCISKSNHYKQIGRSCTSELYPAKISDNRNCILCGQCHKSCTKNNIAVQKRRFAEDLFQDLKLSWAEITFFVIVSGFVIYEILSEWKVTKNVLMAIPNYINESFGFSGNITGSIKAVILFIILPFTFYLIFALIKKIISNNSLKETFTQIVLAILPITASMHLLKALLKTTSRIPYWNFVFSDPKGVETAQLIIDNSEFLDKSITVSISPVLNIIAVLLSVGGIVLSFLVINKQKNQNLSSKLTSSISMLIYAGFFLVTIFMWRIIA